MLGAGLLDQEAAAGKLMTGSSPIGGSCREGGGNLKAA
jgi:hypothetical protein